MADDVGKGAGAAPGPGGPPGGTKDWAAQLTDRLDAVVERVRSQSTDRLVKLARLLVFGLVAAVMGGMAAVLLVIALVRAADRLIPQEVWLAYLVLGGLMTGAGVFLWSKKDRRPAR